MITRDASSFHCLAPCCPSPCLVSHLLFHWERRTDSLDADTGTRWESIEAQLEKPLPPTGVLSVYVCAKTRVNVKHRIIRPKELSRFHHLVHLSGFLFSLILSDLRCSFLLKSPSVPSRTLSFPPSVPRARLQKYQCPLSYNSIRHRHDIYGICSTSALWS